MVFAESSVDESHLNIGNVNRNESTATISDNDVQFTVLQGASSKGKDVLVDSAGFAYSLKPTAASTKYWRCVIRNRTCCCRATVIETIAGYRLGLHPHTHAAQPSEATKRALIKKV